jgi:hypothetical protein
MEEMLYAGPVDDITALIAACKFTSDALFLAEILPPHVVVSAKERQDLLCFAYFDAEIPFAKYTSGRIFHQDFELRWQKNEGETDAVYLGTKRDIPLLKKDLKLKKSDKPKYYYLFGERLKPGDLDKIGVPAEERDFAFAEVRIPRLLLYRPAPQNARRVRLVVREYLDEETSEVKLFRFESLKEAE